MKNKLLFGVLFFIGLGLNGQELYDPQTLYDAPGGVFDINFVREMDIVFEDPNYHNVLVNSFLIRLATEFQRHLHIMEKAMTVLGFATKGTQLSVFPMTKATQRSLIILR